MANELPLVAVACLCEKVLTEKDDVLSVIRIVDQFVVGVPPDVVERLNPHLVMTLALSIKSRGHTGKHEITLQLHGPTKSQDPQKVPVEFTEGPLSTMNIAVVIAIGVVRNFGEGRIDVLFDGEFLTTVPFRVVQGPVEASPGSGTTQS